MRAAGSRAAGTRAAGTRPTVTVLGASGFVGGAVVDALRHRDVTLRTVSRRVLPPRPGGRAGVEHVVADLADPHAVADAVHGSDVVVHLAAAIDGTGTWRVRAGDAAAERVNRELTATLVRVLGRRAGSDRPPVVVLASSAAVAPPGARHLDGAEDGEPASEYGRQKLAAERALHAATAEGRVVGLSLRLSTVVGDGSPPAGPGRGVVATMARRAWAGRPLTVWDGGAVLRDLLYVRDAAAAFVPAAEHADRLAGRHWLVGTGVGTPVRTVFERIALAVAAQSGEPPVPVVEVPPPDHSVPGDASGCTVDPAAFRERTGWRPAVCADEAIRRAVAAAAPA